jgi:hypothetical protein
MTPLHLALAACGLSAQQAAEYLSVSTQSIRDALTRPHKLRCPPGWLTELRGLHQRQRLLADKALEIIATQTSRFGPGQVELGYCVDDAESRMLGLPCVAAHAAVLRMIWEGLPDGCVPIVVPRGTTIGTAGAADAHGM